MVVSPPSQSEFTVANGQVNEPSGCRSFFPILANDPRFVKTNWLAEVDAISAIIVLASICPFCAILGYLTPSLIDVYAAGDPAVAGKAYAINVIGCILGPIFASYVMLPWMSERHAITLLGLPFFVFYLLGWRTVFRTISLGSGAASAAVFCALFHFRRFSRTGIEFLRQNRSAARLRRLRHFIR